MPIPHFDRGCISKWRGIEKGRVVNEKEDDLVLALIGEQLDEVSY